MSKKIIRQRKTATKTRVISILKEKQQAFSHRQLQDFFGNSVDKVTLYRALERLVKEGKLHKINALEGAVQFALCKEKCDKETHHDHHLHFNCTHCGKVICLNSRNPEYSLPTGYTATDEQFLVIGKCPECND